MTAYLDNSATTRPCEAAIDATVQALRQTWHNPSSLYRRKNSQPVELQAGDRRKGYGTF